MNLVAATTAQHSGERSSWPLLLLLLLLLTMTSRKGKERERERHWERHWAINTVR